jgi:hypothetical protein
MLAEGLMATTSMLSDDTLTLTALAPLARSTALTVAGLRRPFM